VEDVRHLAGFRVENRVRDDPYEGGLSGKEFAQRRIAEGVALFDGRCERVFYDGDYRLADRWRRWWRRWWLRWRRLDLLLGKECPGDDRSVLRGVEQ